VMCSQHGLDSLKEWERERLLEIEAQLRLNHATAPERPTTSLT
jgi:hypothetical protein